MHLRFSIAVGTPVMDDDANRVVARVSDVLIEPDSGQIAGFFVDAPALAPPARQFLSRHDIVAWGTVIHVRSRDAISPPEDLVRLQELLSDPRHVLGQRIITQRQRTYLGACCDVQFDTRQMAIEWLFPKKYFLLSQTPVPASEIIEITPQAIIVREPLLPKKDTLSEALHVAPLNEVLPAVSPS